MVHLQYKTHPRRDIALFLVSLASMTLIDLSALPELASVMAYQIMILAAVAALAHLIIAKRKNSSVESN